VFTVIASLTLSMYRCEIPANSGAGPRMQLLVSWIIDNPNAVTEEEVGCKPLSSQSKQPFRKERKKRLMPQQLKRIDSELNNNNNNKRLIKTQQPVNS